MQRNLVQIEERAVEEFTPVISFFDHFHVFVVLLQFEGRLRAVLALRTWKSSLNSIWTISMANDASQLNLIYRIYP